MINKQVIFNLFIYFNSNMKKTKREKKSDQKHKEAKKKISLVGSLKSIYKQPFYNLLIKFFVLICVFYIFWIMPFFQENVVANVAIFYAKISTFFLNLLQIPVKSIGDSLTSGDFSIRIRNGCDAIEATAILLCAMLIYPTSWKNKSIGLLVGLLLLVILNIIRIMSLYFINIYIPSIFDVMHVSIWQVLFIVFPILIILWWIKWSNKELVNS